MQNVRSALQKVLKASLTTTGATFSRFVFAAPLAAIYLLALAAFTGNPVPNPDGTFAGYAALGGIAQILATALLVSLFSKRNFTVGTTFSKTETVQTALIGLVLLGERISAGALMGIAVSLIGVFLISTRKGIAGGGLRDMIDRSALTGLASGALFGLSAVSYRAASLSLADGDFLMRAALTLVCVTVFQSIVMALYMAWREPGQIGAVFKTWRVTALVGATGMLASTFWFTAMTLQNAAYVRALGQVELVFTFAASVLIFRERSTVRECAGIGLVTAGVLILVLTA